MERQLVPSVLPSSHGTGVPSSIQIDEALHKPVSLTFGPRRHLIWPRGHPSVRMLEPSCLGHWQSLQALRC